MGDVSTHQDRPSLALKVVEAVAEHAGVDESKLPPLFEVINPDALNSLFASPSTEKQREPAYVSFRYADHRVVVYDNRIITVE